MYKAGKNPTRARAHERVPHWNEASPFLLPGNRQKTAGNDQRPVDCLRLAKFTDGVFQPVTKLRCASYKAAA